MKTSKTKSRGLWLSTRKRALELGVSASSLVELGLRIVLAVLREGRVPRGLEELLLEVGDEEAATKLGEYAERLRLAVELEGP